MDIAQGAIEFVVTYSAHPELVEGLGVLAVSLDLFYETTARR